MQGSLTISPVNRRHHNRIFEADLKEAKKLQLPGPIMVLVFVVTVFCCWWFDRFGRMNLVEPLIIGCVALGFVIYLKWNLRRYWWFWMSLCVFGASHGILLLYVPWTDKWHPAAAWAGGASIELFAMLWVLSLLQKRAEKAERAMQRRLHQGMNSAAASHEPQGADPARKSILGL